jgi:glycosyltransferase involved in cell wall biosynthesis
VRFAWDQQNQYLKTVGLTFGVKAMLSRMILHYIRTWDVRSANGVDVFLTNSDFVGRRIEKVYRRKATTIYPPVAIEKFGLQEEKQDFYVTASRLVPYKRIDLIVEAFARTPHRRLIVVGEGPEMERIKAKAGPNISLVGYQPDDALKRYMQHARAFIFAAEEDFGIVPVEAQACGTPVIACGRGGVAESVVEGQTGIFFYEQSVEAIMVAVDRFETLSLNPADIYKNAERFSSQRFRDELQIKVQSAWDGHRVRQAVTAPPSDIAERGIADLSSPDEMEMACG